MLTVISSGLIAPIVLGRPFMTSIWGHTEFAALGKLGTPLMFDIGVYTTVIGVTMLIMLTLAEEDGDQGEETI